jgi:hypothetical protein
MGTRISKRLAIAGLGVLGFLTLIAIAGPRLHLFHHDALPTVTTTKLTAPQQPILEVIHKPTFQQMLAPPPPVSKPQKTVCQPCIQAAQEVLARYLSALRTGAGTDDQQELSNVFETPRIYPADSAVHDRTVFDNQQLRNQYNRQLYAARPLSGPSGATR